MERYILVSVIMFVLGLKEKNYKLRVSKGCDPPFPALLAEGTLWVSPQGILSPL